jgi:uncharacterized protein YdiU (UPF0061 family)
MDGYDPATVFSSIDHAGRYAYGNQPRVAQWNLARLAEALLPLLGDDEEAALAAGREALAGFGPLFEAAHLRGLRRKLGLFAQREEDAALAYDLLERMAANRADFTLTFRHLCDAAAGPDGDGAMRSLFVDAGTYDPWAARWRQRLAEEPGSPEARRFAMRGANPAFIPRNHLVEAALKAAVDGQDFAPFEALLAVLQRPYDDQPDRSDYATPPGPEQRVYQTFCGT